MQYLTQTGRVIEIEARAGMFAAVGMFAATESEMRAALARVYGPEARKADLMRRVAKLVA